MDPEAPPVENLCFKPSPALSCYVITEKQGLFLEDAKGEDVTPPLPKLPLSRRRPQTKLNCVSLSQTIPFPKHGAASFQTGQNQTSAGSETSRMTATCFLICEDQRRTCG